MTEPVFDFEDGQVLPIHKPKGWTSFDVVKKIRNAGRFKKIGHAGTLDPLADGLLILCTQKHTKQIESIQAQPKTYIAEFTFGYTTPSLDLETEPVAVADASHLTMDSLKAILQQFTGDIWQAPPLFSAVKVGGKRAYSLARAGSDQELPPKRITIHHIHLLGFEASVARLEVRCSKGTYIRSLARDMGNALGVGGYMSALTRTAIGDYQLQNAWQIENLVKALREAREKLGISPQ